MSRSLNPWGMTELTQGLTDMMNQLMESVNDLKANQIETRETLCSIQSRTEAMEAQVAEFECRSTSSPPSPMAAANESSPA
jgi:hypothetical protein